MDFVLSLLPNTVQSYPKGLGTQLFESPEINVFSTLARK